MKSIIFFLTINIFSLTAFSQIPPGYYDDASGLTGEDLREALRSIITSGHSSNDYDDLYDYYETTDNYTNGKVWDMYSIHEDGTANYWYTHIVDKCSSGYDSEGDCYNREHSVPASWFNDSYPMYADLFMVIPTDGYVNNRRSNYPFGETESATWTSTNGSKVGTCSYPGYSSTVFEPIDDYKGDFAREYFYVATRYKNQISSWSGASFAGNNFSVWTKNMLLEWNESDPLSQKEIDRNNAVSPIQGNRNPFIDHPEWICEIWGGNCGVQNPDNFTATAASESQIDLSWTLNDDNDNVLLAYSISDEFGEPSVTYSPGDNIIGGGEVLFVGGSVSFSHESLIIQTYYYKIWSINSSDEYSTGIETNSMPLLPEPTNNVTNFIVSNATSNLISLTWTDAVGGQLPEAYLIKASTDGIIPPPVDGVPEIDGQFVKNVNYGVETVTFSGLTPSTTYFFEIYPYTNSGGSINYKTDSPESAIGNTLAGSSIIYSGSFETGNEGWIFYNTGGEPDWERTTDGGQYSPGDDGHDGTYYMWYYGWNGNADDWLISPEFNFSGYTDSKFEFWSWMRNDANGNFIMKISADYPGTGNPASYSWADLLPEFATSEFTWTNSGEVDLSAYDDQSCYIAFHYSGTDVDRNWAIDEITVTALLTSTNDSDSEALPPDNQISGSTVSSLADTEPEAFDVFTFDIEDKGTSDGEITQVYNIRIYPGTSNTADWSDHIQGVILSDGSNINISTLSITDSYINMLISPITIDDGESKTFTMTVWLNSENILDNSVMSFMIDADNHGFVADNQFSQFAEIFNSGNDIISNDFIIDVTGVDLLFTQQPSDTEIDQIMNPSPVLQMQDENGNADFDYEVVSVLYSEGSMSGGSVEGTWNSGNLIFGDIIHTEYDSDIALSVISGTFEINSSTFDIYCNPVNVSNLNATCESELSEVSWTNPDCFDEVIIVVSDAPVTGTPVGTYIANSLDYGNELNPDFPDGGKVVYNGTESPQIITGLENGTTYYFKIFTHAYDIWSSGISADCTPLIIQDFYTDIKIYPNPVNDILIIDCDNYIENYSIELISIQGIRHLKINSNNCRTKINLHKYPTGIYIIKISTEKDVFRKKIMIK